MKLRLLVACTLLLAACSKDNNGVGTDTGNACEVIDDCYPDVDHEELAGDVVCLDRVDAGYCTHQCDTDADCCAADGECADDSPAQVCAPFESTGLRMCFLSCEGESDGYCEEEISSDFGCSSTGGGSENRKVCSPKG